MLLKEADEDRELWLYIQQRLELRSLEIIVVAAQARRRFVKSLVAGTMLMAGLAVAAPALAQGVYIGPGGVGVDSGYGHRHSRYDDDDYGRRSYRDSYERRGYYEGRSASPGYGHRNYFYDHY